MAKRRRIPIDKLLQYWDDISKRSDLTAADFDVFLGRIASTMEYFRELYSDRFLHSNRFFARVQIIRMLKFPSAKGGEISRVQYSTMKDVAKKFIRHIKEGFAKDIVSAISMKTPLQDAEAILSTATKLT
jgi:hypothetical protein